SDTFWEREAQGPKARRWWGVGILALSLASGLVYIGVLPALVGLWTYRDRLRRIPGAWVLPLVALALCGALYLIALFAGYMSDRHVLLLTLMLCFWTVAGVIVLGRWLANLTKKPHLAATWATILVALLCVGTVVKTLAPLHPERAGFRAAGYWLAEHARPEDRLVDPYSWSSY